MVPQVIAERPVVFFSSMHSLSLLEAIDIKQSWPIPIRTAAGNPVKRFRNKRVDAEYCIAIIWLIYTYRKRSRMYHT